MKTADMDIDTVTDEDIAYARSVDLNKALTIDEMPLIKALQTNKLTKNFSKCTLHAKNLSLYGLMKTLLPFSKKTVKAIKLV